MPPKSTASEKQVVRIYSKHVVAQQKRVAAADRATGEEQEKKAKKQRKKKAEEDDAAKLRRAREKEGKQCRFQQQPGQQRMRYESDSDSDDDKKGMAVRYKDTLSNRRDTGLVLEEEEEEAKPSPAKVVFDMHGAELRVSPSLFRIQEFLRQRCERGAADVQEILENTAINLGDERNAPFVNRLEACKTIVIVSKSPLAMKIAAPYGVECRRDLVDLFERRLPMGEIKSEDGVVQDSIDEKELVYAYSAVVADIDHLVAQGRLCDAIVRGCTRVLFPSVPGKKAGPIQTWSAASSPGTVAEMRSELEKMGLREEKIKPKTSLDLLAIAQNGKAPMPSRKERVNAMASEPRCLEIVRCHANKAGPSNPSDDAPPL